MGTKKIETKPTMKTWIWLKGPKSKAMQDLRDEFGIDRAKELCGRWLETVSVDSDGDFNLNEITEPRLILKKEVAHVRESVECPKDPPVKVAKIDRSKHPKAKGPKRHVWEPRALEIKDSAPKTTLRALIIESVDEINQLGAENAKLKNQIASLKSKAPK